MELRLTPEHPDILRAKRTIAELRVRAEAEAAAQPVSVAPRLTPAEQARQNRKAEIEKLDLQIAEKTDSEQRLRGVISDYQQRLEATPLREGELIELTRDYDTIQASYRSLLSKKEAAQMSANLERRQIGEQFRILDPPQVPQKPYSPDRPRYYLMGVAAALAVGLGFAAVAEYMDRSMRSEEDVTVALGLPVLATIPIMTPTRFSKRAKAKAAQTAASLAGVAAGLAHTWRYLG
jgi:uncharacterized protein involved in exopolysaccharide biosynthesis